ncbi:DUF3862 domain-containing protein [Clostridium sp. SHJSY1]|uniref:DUF3862 domain-containing protein n=1 Tax=Clostridium sp. SHJSY1 TaxID=2942483 RepID=UPI00287424ED|nr:DUF3862 domain-containing protein [Clostridium sp. SHJSY1]MDS0526062.1 DUF3862 domain-containing protein [Clostridium sp. SHJSY1]
MSKSGKKPFYKKVWVWVILILIVAVIGTQKGKDKNNDTAASNATDTTSSQAGSKAEDQDSKINYDNFLSIKMGQNYNDLINVLGEGKEESSSEISGIKTVIYAWSGKGLSSMNVTIQNGVVTGKAQSGLKKMDADITLDKYNKINNGMTYDQLKEVLGEGQILSQSKIMNTESTIYQYINKDGSNANFTFNGDKLELKAQFQLK